MTFSGCYFSEKLTIFHPGRIKIFNAIDGIGKKHTVAMKVETVVGKSFSGLVGQWWRQHGSSGFNAIHKPMANARERKEASLPKRFIVKVFRVEASSKFALFTQENSDASWNHNPRSTEYATHDSSKVCLIPVTAFPSFFVLVTPVAMFPTVKTRESFNQKWAIRLCCKVISLLDIKIVKPFTVDKRLPQRRSSFINGLAGVFKSGSLHCCHLHLRHQANRFRILAEIKQKFNEVAPFIGSHRLCNTRRHQTAHLFDFFNLIAL